MFVKSIVIEYKGYSFEAECDGSEINYSVKDAEEDEVDSGCELGCVDFDASLIELLSQIEPFSELDGEFDDYITELKTAE